MANNQVRTGRNGESKSTNTSAATMSPVLAAGMLIAVLLISGGLAALWLRAVPPSIAVLTTCVGFGIILASFGTQTEGKIQDWSVAGSGATAILLFLLVTKLWPPEPPSDFVRRVQIDVDPSKIGDIIIQDDTPLHHFRNKDASWIEYVFLHAFRKRELRIEVDKADGASGPSFFVIKAPSDPVHKILLKAKDHDVLSWALNYETQSLDLGENVIFSAQSKIGFDAEFGLQRFGRYSIKSFLSFIATPAFAGDRIPTSPDLLVQSLASSDLATRRDARDLLVDLGFSAVQPLLNGVRSTRGRDDEASDRINLGATYVLSEVLQDDPALKKAISGLLTLDDLTAIVNLTASKDATVQFYAADFLARLQDRRVTAPIRKLLTSCENPTVIRNDLNVLKSVENNNAFISLLSDYLKAPTNQHLKLGSLALLANYAADDKSNNSKTATTILEKYAPDQRYAVIVGSLPTKSAAEKKAAEFSSLLQKCGCGFEAKILPPGDLAPQYWGVTVGTGLLFADARNIRRQSVDAGLPSDAYILVWQRL